MDNPNTQLFYRLINRGRSNSRTTTNCLKIDGEYIFCHEDQRKRFAQYYEDLSVPKEEIYDNSYLNLCKIRQNYVQEALEEYEHNPELFTDTDIEKAIDYLNTKKSPDEFGLTAEHLKYAKSTIAPAMKTIFNNILIHRKVPLFFKSGILTPVLKKEKDPTETSNYRGITVTPITGKTFEYSFLNKLMIEPKTDLQFGFTKGLSPIMASLIISEARYEKKKDTFIKKSKNAVESFQSLSDSHKKMLPGYLDNLTLIQNCVDHNYEIIQLVIKDAEYMFENKTHEPTEDEKEVPPTQFDMDKVRTTIKQFVRDWSADGHSEREACYLPIVMEICEKFPKSKCDPSKISVLVPGAGLGRLAYEIAKQGYSCQGNEWSLFMLMASNFILNKCNAVKSFTLYPWIHQWTNNTYTEDQTASCKFPDVNPAELPPNSNFSMAAGDFLEIYTDPDTFDCVATVFFIDTAHCIISYIETIYNILKPGGYWINLGPLLYHYSDIPNEVSIELSYEELKKVIKQVGFVIQREEKDVRSTYTQNPKSMLRYEYSSVFFTAQKPVS